MILSTLIGHNEYEWMSDRIDRYLVSDMMSNMFRIIIV